MTRHASCGTSRRGASVRPAARLVRRAGNRYRWSCGTFPPASSVPNATDTVSSVAGNEEDTNAVYVEDGASLVGRRLLPAHQKRQERRCPRNRKWLQPRERRPRRRR